MRLRPVCLLLCLTWILLCAIPTAVAGTIELTPDEQAWLDAHPVIRIGPAPNWPPVEFFDDEGNYKGIVADYLVLIEERLGFEFEIVRRENWSQVVESTKNGEIDVWMEAAQTPERDEFLLFSEPWLIVPSVIIVRKDRAGSLSLSDLGGEKVGAGAGYAVADYIEENFPDVELVPVPSIEDGLSMVSFGSLDAFVAASGPASFYIEKTAISNLRVAGNSGFQWDLKTASRKDWPELRGILEKALASIDESERRSIYRRWVFLEDQKEGFTTGLVLFFVAVGVTLLVFLWFRYRGRAADSSGEKQPQQYRKATMFATLRASVAAVVVICAVIAFTAWTHSVLEKRVKNDIGNSLKTVLSSTNRAVHHWIEAREHEVLAWARHTDVVRLCERLVQENSNGVSPGGSTAQEDLREQLAQQLEDIGYEGYLLVMPNGRVVGSDEDAPLGTVTDVVSAEFLDQLLTGNKGAAVSLPRPTSDPAAGGEETHSMMVTAAVVRIPGSDNQPVLIFKIDPEADFTEILQRGRIGESGESYAFNRKGQLISESRFDNDLREIGLIPPGKRGILNLEIRDPGGNLLEGHIVEGSRDQLPFTLMANEATSGRPGINLEGYADYRGVPVIGAWDWDPVNGLGLTTEMDVEEAFASFRWTRRLFTIGSSFSVLLVLLLTTLFLLDFYRRSKLADRIRENEEKMRAIIETAPDAIVTIDEAGIIQSFNSTAQEIFGYSTEDVFGKNVTVLIPDDLVPKHNEGLTRRMGTGEQKIGRHGAEVVGKRKDGSHVSLWLTLGVAGKESGNITVIGMLRDITARKEAERQLKIAQEKSETANRAKSAFLANMSHELRTPMNAIIGYSEMLIEDAEDDGNEEIVSDVQKIHSAGKHLLELINDILDLSKIEAGRMELYLERFDLKKTLAEVVSTIQPLIQKNENEIVSDFSDDIGAVRADVTKVRQALFNLLSNAAKFTDHGTITLSATRTRREGVDWVIMSVRDTGIGIPEEKIEKVFEEFGQADDSTTREYGGTGLGLPISRRFCQMMGGDITVSSVPGEGSVFSIELPAEVDAMKAAKASVEHADTENVEDNDEGVILVVDDDPDSRELLRRALEADGHTVRTAENGVMAMEMARTMTPSVITLDVMMPEMDGWAVLKELKADESLHHIPVIMVSMLEEKGMGYALGAVDYLTKPVDRKKLRQIVEKFATQGRSALVVEDDEANRSLLRHAMEDAGWSVREATNGVHALEQVDLEVPNLILLDLMMPEMDGFEFVRIFRENPRYYNVPIIVVSAKDLTDEERKELSGGVEHIIRKGAHTGEEVIESVLKMVNSPLHKRPEE